MSDCEITLSANAYARRIVPRVPAQIQGDPNDCYPEEPAHAEGMRIVLRLPARCVSKLDPHGYVTVDVTQLVSESDREAAEDSLIEEAGL